MYVRPAASTISRALADSACGSQQPRGSFAPVLSRPDWIHTAFAPTAFAVSTISASSSTGRCVYTRSAVLGSCPTSRSRTSPPSTSYALYSSGPSFDTIVYPDRASVSGTSRLGQSIRRTVFVPASSLATSVIPREVIPRYAPTRGRRRTAGPLRAEWHLLRLRAEQRRGSSHQEPRARR